MPVSIDYESKNAWFDYLENGAEHFLESQIDQAREYSFAAFDHLWETKKVALYGMSPQEPTLTEEGKLYVKTLIDSSDPEQRVKAMILLTFLVGIKEGMVIQTVIDDKTIA